MTSLSAWKYCSLPMKSSAKLLYCETRAKWRAWLAKNFAAAREIWFVYHKKGTGKLDYAKKHASVSKPSVSYEDAVQEALCFGWIDGMDKGLDAARYMQRFTPRKPGSSWSESNIARMKQLIAEGKMTPAGLAAFEGHESRRIEPKPTVMPKALEREFKKKDAARHGGQAWKNFQAFPPGYRRMTIGWVASAKKEETQRKRLAKLIEFSARNERIKFM
ncbi:MAG TPA: YdeI/OmpD-associated family protein [Candidatus Acidoferrales bacterium]|nr:YdeI/OmpD-associated family protein [Candidatus Acidoferrales bacterium]